ncbi:triose-phosphate isomerase [Microbacterium sp. CIAB417]|uniref:triose-phosphate isomerase family protein n=1 Tax=Microbacterium sp. CIAB417 TaxID=2860287 RepID=UPI0035ABB8A7
MRRVRVGVSLKMYFSHKQAVAWFDAVAARVREHEAVMSGRVELFILPTYLQIPAALTAFHGAPVRVGAQDVAAADEGAFTGEVSASELAEIGASMAEIGHAERRRLFGETDDLIAQKTAAALRHGLTPVLCVGESELIGLNEAVATVATQLRAALTHAPDGGVVVAYEPVWAIGAQHPAPISHIQVMIDALRDSIDQLPERRGSSVIYGGSAGPGLLTRLSGSADGLFLGRFAHDPDALIEVLDEGASLAAACI